LFLPPPTNPVVYSPVPHITTFTLEFAILRGYCGVDEWRGNACPLDHFVYWSSTLTMGNKPSRKSLSAASIHIPEDILVLVMSVSDRATTN
jgi:hypothetical protein